MSGRVDNVLDHVNNGGPISRILSLFYFFMWMMLLNFVTLEL